MFVGKVLDTFEIKGLGIVVVTNTTYEQLSQELTLTIGYPVELRMNGEVVLQTKIIGIDHGSPWSPMQSLGFLLPGDMNKSDVPIGSEVWSIDH